MVIGDSIDSFTDAKVNWNGVISFSANSIATRNGIAVRSIRELNGDQVVQYSEDGINWTGFTISTNNTNPIYSALNLSVDQNGTERPIYTSVGAYNGPITENVFESGKYQTYFDPSRTADTTVYLLDADGNFNKESFRYVFEYQSTVYTISVSGWRVSRIGENSVIVVGSYVSALQPLSSYGQYKTTLVMQASNGVSNFSVGSIEVSYDGVLDVKSDLSLVLNKTTA